MKKKQPTIKAILFDMGNVLVHFNARKSSRAFSDLLGVPEERLWETLFISPMEKAYTRGEISSREFFKGMRAHFPDKNISFKTFARLWNDIFTENKEMEKVLKKLKKKYPLYLISNTNELHFEHIKKSFGILKHFKKWFPSHEVGYRKPDPNMFRHVLQEIKLAPGETVFVDDMPEFVESARKLGIHGIQFESVTRLEGGLRKLGVRV